MSKNKYFDGISTSKTILCRSDTMVKVEKAFSINYFCILCTTQSHAFHVNHFRSSKKGRDSTEIKSSTDTNLSFSMSIEYLTIDYKRRSIFTGYEIIEI